MVDHRDAIFEHFSLQPLPHRGIEHLAGADDALHRAQVEPPRHVGAVAHQQPRGGGRREYAGDPVVLDEAVERVRLGKVERPLVGNGGAAEQQRGVDDVAVADDPADVRRRPPHVVGPQPEHPVAHAADVDLVRTVGVYHQLRRGGGARGGQDVGRIVGLHHGMGVVLPCGERQEVFPRQVALGSHGRRRGGAAQHDYPFHGLAAGGDGRVDDLLEAHLAPLAPGYVGGEDRSRAGELHAIGQRAAAKPGKHHQVDGPDARRGEHHHDRLGTRGHVDGDPVAALDPQATQRGRGALHGGQELRVGEHLAFPPLVFVDQRGGATPAALHLGVEAVVAQVGLRPHEPAERGRRPFEHAIPRAEPGQRLGGARPERLQVVRCLALHAPDHRRNQIHRHPPS